MIINEARELNDRGLIELRMSDSDFTKYLDKDYIIDTLEEYIREDVWVKSKVCEVPILVEDVDYDIELHHLDKEWIKIALKRVEQFCRENLECKDEIERSKSFAVAKYFVRGG